MDVVQHQILSLDFWQDTVSYEGKNFPSGTIGCDALNIPAALIKQITELCGSLNLFMGAMQLGMANAELFTSARESALQIVHKLKDIPPFSYLDENDLAFGNVFTFDCVKACYSPEGKIWLDEMLDYVRKNVDYVSSFLASRCPLIGSTRPEASFLMFLDNRKLGFATQEQLVNFYTEKAGLYLNDGSMFGTEGIGFMRLNVATPRAILEKAMNQLGKAYDEAGF